MTVTYTNEVVALPSLFSPLSFFCPQATVQYGDVAETQPQIYEDVHLQVLANLKEDCDVLPFLHLDKWSQLFPHLDPCKRVRLLGGLGKRILSLDRLFHAELRQSVEAYLGFILHAIASGSCHYRTLSVSEVLRTVGIRLKQGQPECGFIEVIDIDHHARKGFEPRHLQSLIDGACIENSTKMAHSYMHEFAFT